MTKPQGRPSEQDLAVTQNQICSRNLLDALIANHGTPSIEEAPPEHLPPQVEAKPKPKPKPNMAPKCPQWFSIVEEVEPPQPKISDIKKAVARHFGINVVDMESARRTAKVVYPRQVAMYLARSLTRRSLPEIGRRLGGRDHTTILHGARKIEADMMKDWTVAFDVAAVEAMI